MDRFKTFQIIDEYSEKYAEDLSTEWEELEDFDHFDLSIERHSPHLCDEISEAR